MGRITQETKDETRNLIIDEATRLFKENGYDKTNTRTIAQNCRLAEGTLFNYFATKDEILLAVFDTMAKRTENADQTPSTNALNTIIDTFMIPLKRMEILPKKFMLDIIIAAAKLSKRKNSLIHRLIALDMSYVKQVEDNMRQHLQFPKTTMNPKLLAEIAYSALATNYLFYLLDETMEFKRFEAELRSKLTSLMQPYCINGDYERRSEKSGDENG